MYGAFRRSPCHVASLSPDFLSACRSSAPTGESPKFCSLRTLTSRLQLGTNTCPPCTLLVGVRKLQNFGLSPVGADDLQADRKSGLSEATWHGDRRKAPYIHRASIAQQGEFSRAKQIGIGF